MKEYGVLVRFSNPYSRSKEIKRKLYGKKKKYLHGYTESGEKGFRVWVDARMNEREQADTFFHEMTHVWCGMKGLKLGKRDEEHLCGWVGYMVKVMMGDRLPKKYGRKV